MSNDRTALSELHRESKPRKHHVVLHYLYLPTQESASEVAAELRMQGFKTEERLGADGVNWLVLARHEVVPTEGLIEATRVMMENRVRRVGGEYDGWEAEVKR